MTQHWNCLPNRNSAINALSCHLLYGTGFRGNVCRTSCVIVDNIVLSNKTSNHVTNSLE